MRKHSVLKQFVAVVCLLSTTTLWISCSKDNDNQPSEPTYEIPTTYNFANADYSTQTNLLLMADALVNEINLANVTPNHVVTAVRLNALFNNSGSPFNNPTLDNSGVSLAEFCPAPMKADLLRYFDSIEVYSNSSAAPVEGTAGVGQSSTNAAKLYLLSPNGQFYSQIVKKTLMGFCAYNITNVYLQDSINSTTDTTLLAHYWDAAFGFFGVPADFPTTTTGSKYFGSYSNQVNPGLNSNANIMNAFLKGRAAIGHNDLTTMKAQAKLLIATFDTLNAACVVQEMHESNEHLEAGDEIATYGTLSEAIGFVRNFTYNQSTSPIRVITDNQISQLFGLFDAAHPQNPNLYDFVGVNQGLTTAQIEEKTSAIEQLMGQIYHFSAAQLPNL